MSDGKDPRWREDGDNADKTVILNPGHRRPTPPAPSLPDVGSAPAMGRMPPIPERDYPEPPFAEHPALPPESSGQSPGMAVNHLVSAASSILNLIATLPRTIDLADPMGLRDRVEKQLQSLAADTGRAASTPDTLRIASYCLCTAIDEAVLRTPWGGRSDWEQYSLLSRLHGDTKGGDRFFEFLSARMQDPGPNIDLLELLFICLSLGFEGKYALYDRGEGDAKRKRVIDSLYEVIRRQRGAVEQELSPHWQSEDAAKVGLDHPVPLWVVASIAAAFLLTTYLVFSYFLSNIATETLDSVATLGHEVLEPPASVAEEIEPERVPYKDPITGTERDIVVQPPTPEPIVPPPPEPEVDVFAAIQGFLESEIQQGRVTVKDDFNQIRVRISAPDKKALFQSGSDRLSPEFNDVVERIRAGIIENQADIRGDITVVGHTDSIPIRRSIQFQDNYDLSLARAKTVAKMLAADTGQRITNAIETVGKGASEPAQGGDPAAGNRTAEQRAMNRRVEVLIDKQQGDAQ